MFITIQQVRDTFASEELSSPKTICAAMLRRLGVTVSYETAEKIYSDLAG